MPGLDPVSDGAAIASWFGRDDVALTPRSGTLREHTKGMSPCDLAIDLLEQLDAVLESESEALRSFDAAGIDEAARRKDEIDQQLSPCLTALRATPLDGDKRHRVEALRTRIVQRGQDNLRRLEATAGAIRELIGALTGTEPATYGPRNRSRAYQAGAPSQAVLTAEIV